MTSKRLGDILDSIELLVTEARDLLSSTEETSVVPGQGTLTKPKTLWLKERVARWPGAATLFRLAANAPESVIHYDTAVSEAGLNDIQMRNELAAVSRLTNREWGQKLWPVEAWQSSSTGKMEYRMPKKVAEWWTEEAV